ncbi:MAG: hypothetical protein IPO21_02865 [Bacteroidales bacterium]|nr:hypothetical protein [Bacteroidales bacterium]
MNKQEGSYFKMFLNVQDSLDNYSSIWSTIPILLQYKNELDELISRIVYISQDAQTYLGVSEHKKKMKLTIALKLSTLSGTIQAYAAGTDNADLANSVKMSKSTIEAIKDLDLDAVTRNIVKIAQERLKDLANYGVTENMLTEILTSLEEFNGMIGKPRSIRNSKFVALETAAQLFDECNNLLRNKTDKVMLMFRDSNPDFYSSYERARKIVEK